MENNLSIVIVTFGLSLLLSILFLGRFIEFSKKKNLLDIPDDRKKHTTPTPSSGGIVLGLVLVLLLPYIFVATYYTVIICLALSLVILGYYDDRNDLSARVKFGIQSVVIILALVEVGPLELIPNSPFYFNEIVSFLFILGFTNSFNLIDGVDGLAGSYGTFVLIILTSIFLWHSNYGAVMICVTVLGSIIGFLKYNWNPAKLFMGDTGSLFLGFFISIFTIIACQKETENYILNSDQLSNTILLLSALTIPMMDTLRVMIARMIIGNPPFKADRTHLHHILMKIGLKPKGVSSFFLSVTLFLILIALALNQFQFNLLFILVTLVSTTTILFSLILFVRMRRRVKRMRKYENSLNYIIKNNQLIRNY